MKKRVITMLCVLTMLCLAACGETKQDIAAYGETEQDIATYGETEQEIDYTVLEFRTNKGIEETDAKVEVDSAAYEDTGIEPDLSVWFALKDGDSRVGSYYVQPAYAYATRMLDCMFIEGMLEVEGITEIDVENHSFQTPTVWNQYLYVNGYPYVSHFEISDMEYEGKTAEYAQKIRVSSLSEKEETEVDGSKIWEPDSIVIEYGENSITLTKDTTAQELQTALGLTEVKRNETECGIVIYGLKTEDTAIFYVVEEPESKGYKIKMLYIDTLYNGRFIRVNGMEYAPEGAIDEAFGTNYEVGKKHLMEMDAYDVVFKDVKLADGKMSEAHISYTDSWDYYITGYAFYFE